MAFLPQQPPATPLKEKGTNQPRRGSAELLFWPAARLLNWSSPCGDGSAAHNAPSPQVNFFSNTYCAPHRLSDSDGQKPSSSSAPVLILSGFLPACQARSPLYGQQDTLSTCCTDPPLMPETDWLANPDSETSSDRLRRIVPKQTHFRRVSQEIYLQAEYLNPMTHTSHR